MLPAASDPGANEHESQQWNRDEPPGNHTAASHEERFAWILRIVVRRIGVPHLVSRGHASRPTTAATFLERRHTTGRVLAIVHVVPIHHDWLVRAAVGVAVLVDARAQHGCRDRLIHRKSPLFFREHCPPEAEEHAAERGHDVEPEAPSTNILVHPSPLAHRSPARGSAPDPETRARLPRPLACRRNHSCSTTSMEFAADPRALRPRDTCLHPRSSILRASRPQRS